MAVDPQAFRQTMGLFATGVAVITVRTGDAIHGMTANALTSVSLDPLLLLVCISRRSRMVHLLRESSSFAINILHAGQEAVSCHFAGQQHTDMLPMFTELNGTPVLGESMATLRCTVERTLDGGDHIIVLGRVDALTRTDADLGPLLFFNGRYCQLAG